MRIYHFVESWAFLKPHFGPMSYYKSHLRPKDYPEPDYWATVVIRFLWTISGFFKQFPILVPLGVLTGILPICSMIHRWVVNSQIKKMENSGYDFSKGRGTKIPEWDWKKRTPQEFYDEIYRIRHPCILRGFMNDSKLLQEFSFDNLLKKYGDEKVLVCYLNEGREGVLGTLKEMNNPGVYLQAIEKLFRKFPETNDLFEFDRLAPYFAGDGKEMRPGYSQMFAGFSQGTGSPFHSAPVWNWFYMIDGTKHWFFIDPYESFWVYPFFTPGRGAAITTTLYPDQYEAETFPGYKYALYYEGILQPGDVMFVPPWWWHAIKNTTEKSVGVASRWHTGGEIGSDFVFTEEDYGVFPYATFNFFSGWYSWVFLDQVLKEPSPTFDEHATLREKNTRFIHAQRKLAYKPGINFMGYRFTF